MTPKERAIELANKFYEGNVFDKTKEGHLAECEKAKKFALIAVHEILKSHYKILVGTNQKTYDYWYNIKQEIEKL